MSAMDKKLQNEHDVSNGNDVDETDIDTGASKRVRTPTKKQNIPEKIVNDEEKSSTKIINVAKNAIGNEYKSAGNSDSSPSTSPPRKKLISALKEKLADEEKASRIKLAHEIAIDGNFKLPDSPIDDSVPLAHDKSPEANKKRMEKAVKEVVQKAFWDCVRDSIESDPPRYEHAFILLEEIKGILLSLLPTNRVTSFHKKIEEYMDMDLFRQQAENDTLDVRSVASFVINMMASLCAPARDEQVASLRSIEDVVDMFKEIHKVLDLMKIDLANYAIKTVRPHIQQQQFEYERSQFAQLVQKSPDGLKKTKNWVLLTFHHISDDFLKMKVALSSDQEQSKEFEERRKAALSPLSVLKTAFTKILSPDFDMNDLPETLQMDEERLVSLRTQVEQLVLVSSVMLTACGVYGQPLASHQAFLNKLKDVLMTLTEPDTNSDKKDLLERISIQCCKEAEEYVSGKGQQVERCVTQDKQTVLKGKIAALDTLRLHPVYSVLYKRTVEYLRTTAEIISNHISTTPPNIPAPPPGLSFVASELVAVSLQYSKLVNLNQTIYGPFYVPILREVLGIPKPDSNSTQNNAMLKGAKKKLNMDSEEIKSNIEKPVIEGRFKVTGSINDLD